MSAINVLLTSNRSSRRLVNLAVGPPGVKYRESNTAFVQMENISHFLRACQSPPMNLQPHDAFLTVDLYEAKDPAQVMQCLGAFSRRACALQPGKFPKAIGKSKGDTVSPQLTGSSQGGNISSPPYSRSRGVSNVSESMRGAASSGRASPTKAHTGSPGSPKNAVSAWSNKKEEDTTIPAWNIHQYGYMGGATQGNLGISFGARRQITSNTPTVPSLAEKEKRRREAAAEEEKQKAQEEEAEHQRRLERDAEEERARAEEERRLEEETRKLREKERQEVEEERKRWEAEQRKWEEEDHRRQQEEKEAEERFEKERQRKRELADTRLNGQFLSQYQTSQQPSRDTADTSSHVPATRSPENERIKVLERELELAKEREQRYENEHQELARARGRPSDEETSEDHSRSRSRPAATQVKPSYDLSSMEQERQLLRSEWQPRQDTAPVEEDTTPEKEDTPPPVPPRSLPEPPAKPPRNVNPPTASRPLPDPANYASKNRTDTFLEDNPPPKPSRPSSHRPPELSTTSEVDEENKRRINSTQKTRAGGWASKSLLEREMERERERQREWEDNQKQTQEASGHGENTADVGPGEGAWDVNQYGYMGGDNQNRGGTGIGLGARRQIIGPRPPP